jgi:hypothetical protein
MTDSLKQYRAKVRAAMKMTKHTQARPLRLDIWDGYIVATSSPDAVGIDARIIATCERNAHAAVQAWIGRANAYPRLVEALREACKPQRAGEALNTRSVGRDLLRELGEE